MKRKKSKQPVVVRRRPFRETEAAEGVQAPKSDHIHKHVTKEEKGLTHNPFAVLAEKT